MIKKEMCTIISHQEIADSIYKMTIQGELTGEIISPGQFVHIKVSDSLDPLLRRPISISSYDKENRMITMIYRKEGKGTTMLAEKKSGMKVDVLGPLGNGFPVEETKMGETALLVGGGIGVPPLYELSKQLKEKGVNVIHILGFQTKSAVFYEKEFEEIGQTYVATVDGTHGIKGFVTDVITEKHISFDCLYACGPTPMLKALEQRFPDKKVYISLEERMACAVGACFACVHKCTDGTGYKKVCSDGPVFRAGEVIL
jgi:dihydroorotate dehydrogenase electron transfer subunit